MTQSPADKSASAEGPDPIAGTKILVVDDNAQNLELLVAYLDGLNCQVVTAVDGLDALEKVKAETPDLILLDIMMPRMSGFEVCRKLKSAPATRDIPIVMVTALNELGDIERGVESGTDDFITKPVNRLELVTRIKSLLRVRSLKSELERTLAYLNDMDAGRE
jgi:two-component system cell cycle response regulator